jgi:hypothetical protein
MVSYEAHARSCERLQPRGRSPRHACRDFTLTTDAPLGAQTRNAKGGVVFHEEEINDAFHLLNASGARLTPNLVDFRRARRPGAAPGALRAVQRVVSSVHSDAAPRHCNSHVRAFPVGGEAGRDSFSREDLTDFLDKYFPGMLTVKEIRTLVGPNGMKVERLRKLLLDNDLPETFDPAQEAFKVSKS